VPKRHPIDTNVNETNLNNVNRINRGKIVENSGGDVRKRSIENKDDINDIKRKIGESLKDGEKCNFTKPKGSGNDKNTVFKGGYSNNSIIEEYPVPGRYRSRERELLAREIEEELNDNHSLGAFRAIADKIPEQKIRIFLSIIKDTYLTGKIKKSRGAMFISLARAYTGKNNINLNFK